MEPLHGVRGRADLQEPWVDRRVLGFGLIGPANSSAYQGFGSGLPIEDLRTLQAIATGGLRPDLTILLDLPPEAGLRRKGPDDRTRFELAFDLDFHRRVRDGFLALAAREPDRIQVVDAGGSAARVWEAVRQSVDRLRGDGAPADDPERAGERIQR